MGLNIVLAYYFWYVLVSNYKELKTNDNFALETHSFVSQVLKSKQRRLSVWASLLCKPFVLLLYEGLPTIKVYSVVRASLTKMMTLPRDGKGGMWLF